MYQTIYESPFHHPTVCFLVTGVFLLVLVRRLPFLWWYLVSFSLCILADAFCTGGFSPLGKAPPGLQTAVALIFVLLGDLRYFLLLERALREKDPLAKTPSRAWLVALGMTLIVPILSFVPGKLHPQLGTQRVLFLIYETLFVLVVLVLRWGILPRRMEASKADPEVRHWLYRVSLLEGTLYAGWALADVLILAGLDIGHLLRIVPNVLYYAVFLPFVGILAPRKQLAVPK